MQFLVNSLLILTGPTQDLKHLIKEIIDQNLLQNYLSNFQLKTQIMYYTF